MTAPKLDKETTKYPGGMLIDGLAATQAIDTSGEVLDVEGCDITTLDTEGVLNWEHRGEDAEDHTSLDIVGKIVYAKKLFSEKDCENDRQLKFFKKIDLPCIYIIARLYDGAGHVAAQGLAAQIRDHIANGEPPIVRFSIEGTTTRTSEDKKTLKESIARRVACTIKPCNRSAVSGLIADPNAPPGFDKAPGKIAEDILANVLARAERDPNFAPLGAAAEFDYEPLSKSDFEGLVKGWPKDDAENEANRAAHQGLHGSHAIARDLALEQPNGVQPVTPQGDPVKGVQFPGERPVLPLKQHKFRGVGNDPLPGTPPLPKTLTTVTGRDVVLPENDQIGDNEHLHLEPGAETQAGYNRAQAVHLTSGTDQHGYFNPGNPQVQISNHRNIRPDNPLTPPDNGPQPMADMNAMWSQVGQQAFAAKYPIPPISPTAAPLRQPNEPYSINNLDGSQIEFGWRPLQTGMGGGVGPSQFAIESHIRRPQQQGGRGGSTHAMWTADGQPAAIHEQLHPQMMAQVQQHLQNWLQSNPQAVQEFHQIGAGTPQPRINPKPFDPRADMPSRWNGQAWVRDEPPDENLNKAWPKDAKADMDASLAHEHFLAAPGQQALPARHPPPPVRHKVTGKTLPGVPAPSGACPLCHEPMQAGHAEQFHPTEMVSIRNSRRPDFVPATLDDMNPRANVSAKTAATPQVVGAGLKSFLDPGKGVSGVGSSPGTDSGVGLYPSLAAVIAAAGQAAGFYRALVGKVLDISGAGPEDAMSQAAAGARNEAQGPIPSLDHLYGPAQFTWAPGGQNIRMYSPGQTAGPLHDDINVNPDGTVGWAKQGDVDEEMAHMDPRVNYKRVQQSIFEHLQNWLKSNPTPTEPPVIKSELAKTITAGGYNAAPGALTGGAALQREDLSLMRNKVRKALSTWNKSEKSLRDHLKHEMPEVAPEFINLYADAADKYTIAPKRKLFKSEKSALLVRKFENLTIEMTGLAARIKAARPLRKAEAAAAEQVHHFGGHQTKLGLARVHSSDRQSSKPHTLLGFDDNHFFSLPDVEPQQVSPKGWDPEQVVKLPRHGQGRLYTVVNFPERVEERAVADANQHGHPVYNDANQASMIHGLDFGAKQEAGPKGFHNSDSSGWRKGPKGKLFVKGATNAGSENLARHEVLYHNLARDVFGMGEHLAPTAYVRHPKTGQEFAAIEKIDGHHVGTKSHAYHEPGSPITAAPDDFYRLPVDKNDARHLLQAHHDGTLDKLALMDMVMGNMDRSQFNWMLDKNGKVKLLDHEFAFEPEAYDSPQFWRLARNLDLKRLGQPPSANIHIPLNPAAREWASKLDPELLQRRAQDHGLPPDRVSAMIRRLQSLQQAVKNPDVTAYDAHNSGRPQAEEAATPWGQ